MRVLITGSSGYIGSETIIAFQKAGYEVVGLDCDFYQASNFYPSSAQPYRFIRKDIRQVELSDLEKIDVVVHLAALSNDPLGELDPDLTFQINHLASVRLAKLANQAGVSRFIMASTASVYGIAIEPVSEDSQVNPITAYAKSKRLAELEIAALATDKFSPVFLRPATAFGIGSRLRTDIVLNDFCATVCATGKIKIMSDGSPRRPAVHVRDIAATILACATAPRSLIHNEIFNVGSNKENYSVKELAEMVRAAHGSAEIEFTGEHSDSRSYYVLFDKLHSRFQDYLKFSMTSLEGVKELFEGLKERKYSADDHLHGRYVRLKELRRLLDRGEIDRNLYFKPGSSQKNWELDRGILGASFTG